MNRSKKGTVLQIIPSLHSGGVERGVIDTANELKKQGFTPIVASNGGSMASLLEKSQIKHIKLNLQTKNPLKLFTNIKKIREISKDNKVDIIHIRSRAPMISSYFACKDNPDIKTVSTIHGPYSVNLTNFKPLCNLKRFYNSFMFKSDAIITVSNFIKEYSIKNYQPLFNKKLEDKITIIPRGVDTQIFDPDVICNKETVKLKKEWGICENKKVILFPARITSWKGHEFLIEALKDVKNDYICVFIGSNHGHEEFCNKIREKIKRSNLDSKIKFLGNQKNMPLAYSTADIVISASTKPEAFGRVAIEGQAMKKITIATNIGGSLETIINGKTGFLVENKDIADFTSKIDKALSLSKKDSQEIGNAARANVLENFTNQRMFDSTIEVYNKLLL